MIVNDTTSSAKVVLMDLEIMMDPAQIFFLWNFSTRLQKEFDAIETIRKQKAEENQSGGMADLN